MAKQLGEEEYEHKMENQTAISFQFSRDVAIVMTRRKRFSPTNIFLTRNWSPTLSIKQIRTRTEEEEVGTKQAVTHFVDPTV